MCRGTKQNSWNVLAYFVATSKRNLLWKFRISFWYLQSRGKLSKYLKQQALLFCFCFRFLSRSTRLLRTRNTRAKRGTANRFEKTSTIPRELSEALLAWYLSRFRRIGQYVAEEISPGIQLFNLRRFSSVLLPAFWRCFATRKSMCLPKCDAL